MGGIVRERMGVRFDQSTLYACVKFSSNKLLRFSLRCKIRLLNIIYTNYFGMGFSVIFSTDSGNENPWIKYSIVVLVHTSTSRRGMG